MRLNTAEKVYLALRDLKPALELPEDLRERARVPIDRMLAFTAALKGGQPAGALVPDIGAA